MAKQTHAKNVRRLYFVVEMIRLIRIVNFRYLMICALFKVRVFHFHFRSSLLFAYHSLEWLLLLLLVGIFPAIYDKHFFSWFGLVWFSSVRFGVCIFFALNCDCILFLMYLCNIESVRKNGAMLLPFGWFR